MISAPIAKDEFERLSTLLDYEILDTQPEIEYDDITQLASYICKTPIATVTLVDENRQWFKSRRGIDLSETPRDVSFCGHAIHQRDVFIVNDSLKDERFFDNPLVKESNVIFYAGAPLVSPNGHAVGTICVIDNKPRQLTEDQIKALKLLSKQVVTLLELRKSYHRLNQNYENLRDLSKKVHDHEQVLIHSTKMAALGEMASGAAHEINNPLTIISGRNDQILGELKKQKVDLEKIEKYSAAINDAIARTTKIVRGLKNFSGANSESQKKPFYLVNLIDTIDALVSERARSLAVGIEMSAQDDCVVASSGIQTSQIFINLFNNSFDALATLKNKWIRIAVVKKDGFAEISFTDSGTGIPPEIREKMMQPFFTTKSSGKNAGLGLSISQGLANSQGGSLEHDPTSPNTKFILRLPLAK